MTNHIDITDNKSSTMQYLSLVPLGGTEFAIASSDPSGLVDVAYDSVVITYTDATKATISTVVFKLGVDTVCTLTLTQATLTDTWARS
jgi:hypothetical protein